MEENDELFRSSKNTPNASQNEGLSPSKSTQTWTFKALLQEQRDDGDEQETSEVWLEWRNLESCGLTLSHLLSHCSTAAVSHRVDLLDAQLEIDSESLAEFEMQLYHRVQWLTRGSRKIFGMVTGSRLGVLIDSSDMSCSEERLSNLQRHLLLLVEEQLCLKKQLHFLSIGTEVSSLWERPRDVNPKRLQEVQEWILRLRPSGECNLLQALEVIRSHAHLDSLLIILSSYPDQDVDILLSSVSEVVQEMSLSVHVVSFDSCSPEAVAAVKNISKVTGGRFHLFSAALGVVDSSSDLEPLWAEIKAARAVLHHAQDVRRCGRLNDTAVSLVSEISTDLDLLSLSDLNSGALCVQPADSLPSTSAEWLKTHGLKAKKLNLYHVLAPNVYSPLEGFVPILGKNVQSRVHKKAVVQFEWHDGTLKNLHVDLPLLQNYQRWLLEAEGVLEDRVMWLNDSSSRQIWGTVCEQSVHVLLDMSDMSAHHQLHIQHAIRVLLQEQLPNTHRFNIVAFGSGVKVWREQTVSSNHQNLQDAWQWVQELECAGHRNTLTALRHVVETEPHPDSSLTHGVYLLTTGAPDQDSSSISSYVSEFCAALRIHVCLFTREDAPLRCSSCYISRAEVALFLRNLAHNANGRFHWITDTGTVESDDLTALIREMEKAADYWQKCCELVDSLLQRSSSAGPEEAHDQECRSPARCAKAWTQKHTLPPPRETRLSSARLRSPEGKRSPAWRPNSAKAVIPPARPLDGWELVRLANSAKVKKKQRIPRSALDSEEDSPVTVGSALKHLKANSVQKWIKIPKYEEISSSKQWLKRFGVRTLKLDLHKLLSVPACTHRKKLVPSVSRSVSAKYCAIFPSVHLNGRVRHLFLSSGELKQYLIQTERVLQRYAQRMQWLLSGSRRVFGCVLEKDVCVIQDVSGSMSPCHAQLQRELTSLIWDQLHTNRVRFSMVAFSEEVRVWQEELVEASEERCRDAVTWLGQLNTHGGTSILHALQAACVFGDSVGVYVISDGRWDCSCSLVLKETERLTSGKHITIHTVTLSSPDSTAVVLKSLAHKTGGRFHQVPTAADMAAARGILSSGFGAGADSVLPEFYGDDLKRLRNEIEQLRMFQKQAKDFREMLLMKNPESSSLK
ncbi:von Willebrand factor A domain-containing protein 3A-like isoform X2 [Neoarius graeffei]|uniref:von Willebrand factor A domain-containing protein 3A-like isoform X2 n=1 Tax=Neoarius graeffei TaxID=443677 RepID=UPI00298C5ECA|nr:von Willebrand factor A domain-containing protein 3A-like isoform X2 [Neoarius graeffei]